MTPIDATEAAARYFENMFTFCFLNDQSMHQIELGEKPVLRCGLSKGTAWATFHCGDISIVFALLTNI